MQFGRSGSPEPPPEHVARLMRGAMQMQARERLIPVCWPVPTVLARTDDHLVAIRALWVYPDSVQFDLRVLARRRDRRLLKAFGMQAMLHSSEPAPPDIFRFGVQLSDGRTAANFEGGPEALGFLPVGGNGDGLRLSAQPGGGGNETRHDLVFSLNALPPDGELALVCAWPSVGLPETTTVLDATGMAEAATRVIDPWPGETPEPGTGFRPPRIRLGDKPPDSFFRPILGFDEPD